jgi:hypothetical protein
MAGGLLNIVAIGNNNVFLTGNPSKTFFKVTYSKYTNFGLQKFRIDYEGARDLRLTETSTFTFKIPRYAELLMDTYLVVTLPDIWSPIYYPSDDTGNFWSPYEFKWIRNLGTTIIKEVSITCGSVTLQKYSGQYLAAMVDRDFTSEKKKLFNKMTGNDPSLYDPANVYDRVNSYPSAFYTKNSTGAEPSIRGRNLYIPINTWFTLNNGMAFPLISLQYNELCFTVTLRPIQELFQIRDVFEHDHRYNFPYIQPDFIQSRFQMYRFLQTPPSVRLDAADYENKISTWNADIHLLSTYAFLTGDEAKQFTLNEQVYLVKDVFEYFFENITGASRIKLNSTGMVSSWMWFLQRNDVNLRNEWTNYTNFPYRTIPGELTYHTDYNPRTYNIGVNNTPGIISTEEYSLGLHPLDGSVTGFTTTGDYQVVNQREILQTMGIILNGEYRENVLASGVYDYIEKYTRTQGFAEEGLYCYNFCLNTSPFEYQPSGAINLNKFTNIQLELTTYVPPFDPSGTSFDVLYNTDGIPIAARKSSWQLYNYNYNLTLYEERYNILSFISGNCGMLYAR